jgi:hypothetical protein
MAVPSRAERETGGTEGRARRSRPEAVCGGGGSDESPTHCCKREPRVRGRGHRAGVTSDEAESAPQLRVGFGEGPRGPEPPVKRRVKTHPASAQGSSTPVPWRWRSRAARIGGWDRPRLVGPRGSLDDVGAEKGRENLGIYRILAILRKPGERFPSRNHDVFEFGSGRPLSSGTRGRRFKSSRPDFDTSHTPTSTCEVSISDRTFPLRTLGTSEGQSFSCPSFITIDPAMSCA